MSSNISKNINGLNADNILNNNSFLPLGWGGLGVVLFAGVLAAFIFWFMGDEDIENNCLNHDLHDLRIYLILRRFKS